MHDYTNYHWLRGFNVVPSWGARIDPHGEEGKA